MRVGQPLKAEKIECFVSTTDCRQNRTLRTKRVRTRTLLESCTEQFYGGVRKRMSKQCIYTPFFWEGPGYEANTISHGRTRKNTAYYLNSIAAVSRTMTQMNTNVFLQVCTIRTSFCLNTIFTRVFLVTDTHTHTHTHTRPITLPLRKRGVITGATPRGEWQN